MEEMEYHIRIKKDYANETVLKLQEDDAIEIIATVPEWQQKETLKRLEAYSSNPDDVISEEEMLSVFNEDE